MVSVAQPGRKHAVLCRTQMWKREFRVELGFGAKLHRGCLGLWAWKGKWWPNRDYEAGNKRDEAGQRWMIVWVKEE